MWIEKFYNDRIESTSKAQRMRKLKENTCPVDWSCRIHQLYLCRGVRPPNECPTYDTKQSDDEVPVMLELWGMRSTPSIPLFFSPIWLGVVAHDWVTSMGQIELKYIIMLNWIPWNRTVLVLKLRTNAKLNSWK